MDYLTRLQALKAVFYRPWCGTFSRYGRYPALPQRQLGQCRCLWQGPREVLFDNWPYIENIANTTNLPLTAKNWRQVETSTSITETSVYQLAIHGGIFSGSLQSSHVLAKMAKSTQSTRQLPSKSDAVPQFGSSHWLAKTEKSPQSILQV